MVSKGKAEGVQDELDDTPVHSHGDFAGGGVADNHQFLVILGKVETLSALVSVALGRLLSSQLPCALLLTRERPSQSYDFINTSRLILWEY